MERISTKERTSPFAKTRRTLFAAGRAIPLRGGSQQKSDASGDAMEARATHSITSDEWILIRLDES
jgi:hypothetical protein